ncbi:GNAT family protein [Pantoea sp. EA-12]|uniref:GNAT family N-acetyltransferase n=1 Tax=Pantoea sp. EA-12 TaxID=3043303 RepID=UPI0024B62BE7|nr:GNAT family protein [Pantoea sp. EA-12]MDI9222466.1 GNAT family protein [Pantoea sp. EA-12]
MYFDILSNRLQYRQINAEDWPFFLALQQDDQVMKFVADPQPEAVIRRERFEVRLPQWHTDSSHWLCLVMMEKGSVVPLGVTGFIDRGDGIAEVGFMLATSAQGKGFGAESLRDISQFALMDLGYRKLVATVTAGNQASRRTLLKVGFQQEGTLRKSYFLGGEWRDDWLFGLLAEEFHAELLRK